MTDRIMLVEDEMIVAMDVRQRLEALGYEVAAHASSGTEAIQHASKTSPDLILMDIKIRGDLDGIETAAKIRESEDIPIIFLTAFADDATLKRARLTEAFGYLIKPFEDRELHSAIEIAIYKHRMEKKLRESEERYRKVVETSPDGISILGLDGSIISVNQKFAELWGYHTPQALVDLNIFDLISSEDRLQAKLQMGNIADGNKTRPFELRFLSKDESFFIGELNAACLHDSNGQVNALVAFTRDITERKMVENAIQKLNGELEQLVDSRTASLKVSNQELESFAYSVSHDLRAPLRTMNGFSQLLLEDYAHVLDPQGQDYLKRIQNASRTMAGLIDSLLKLSRIARAEMITMEVDLTPIARQISSKLTASQPERSAEIIIPDQLVVNADPSLMSILLENLLGNAWKYSSKVVHTRIELGSSFKNEKLALFIKDNGIGFNMDHADKLFNPFQRLHTDREFEGNGIGLSIVQRIIRRHGGRIWAESEAEKGATFYFTLS